MLLYLGQIKLYKFMKLIAMKEQGNVQSMSNATAEPQ